MDTFSTMDMEELLDLETEIIWLNPEAQAYLYLREGLMERCDSRVPKWFALAPRSWPIVAYGSPPHEEVIGGRRIYSRRFWWLKSSDYPLAPMGVYSDVLETGDFPSEAVDPESIKVGRVSEDGRP